MQGGGGQQAVNGWQGAAGTCLKLAPAVGHGGVHRQHTASEEGRNPVSSQSNSASRLTGSARRSTPLRNSPKVSTLRYSVPAGRSANQRATAESGDFRRNSDSTWVSMR